ncbi:MAG: protein DpdE [Actinomycetota bacterium]
MATAPLRPASFYTGRWLRSKSHPELGFGYCKEKQGDKFVFSYVDVPGVAEHEFLISPDDVIDSRIPTGTRVWLRGDPFGWQPGEVQRQLTGNRYEISLVGQVRKLPVPQDLFKVRWSQPLEKPIEAIAIGMAEAPTYYEARSALLSELVRQRAACRGLTAAISAPIDLFQHQIDTAARVLADPVMRYLLADEVGLGKTIEAGIVIRQFLIDDPSARVVVLCPETLVGQWMSELNDRLGLGEFLRNTNLKVVPHSSILASRSPNWLGSYELIVIDEAHPMLPSIEFESELGRLLSRAEGLLALSATPMRGDLETFRRLLELVDPVAFGQSTAESFQTQLHERERSARDLQVLTARRASLGQKAEILGNLEADFPGDRTVSELIGACRSSDDPRSSDWAKLSDYVREIYRLSRRMIRHRRSSDVTDSYTVAGRVPTFIEISEPSRPIIDDFLESYRIQQSGENRNTRFVSAVTHALAGPVAMLEFLKNPTSPDERAFFDMAIARIEMSGTDERLRVAADVISSRVEKGQLVVATSMFPQVLDALEPILEKRIAAGKVHRHLGSMTPQDRDDAVSYFLGNYSGGVLLADSSAEEGRNLQEAEVLVNLDLPLDINQLEQRVGRLDRYSARQRPAEIVVVTESRSEWVSAHIKLLKDGIGIFDESVSTVQRLLTNVLNDLIGSLLPKGAEAFDVDLAELRSDLDVERDNIDVLEELESVEAASVFTPEAFDALIDYESNADDLRNALHRLTIGTGSLALGPRESTDGVVTFGSVSRTGLAADEAFELERLLKPKAYERTAALENSGVMPFRIGDPLVDWLQNYLRIDERGRASAFARAVPGLQCPTLWLRCEFLVEFDSAHCPTARPSAIRRLSRRAEGHFQPMRLETWTDPSGHASEGLVREVLSRPFSARDDKVLRGEIWEDILAELPSWQRLCRDSAEAAWAEIRNSDALTKALEAAVESAEEDTAKRLAILDARALRLSEGSEWDAVQNELETERKTAHALISGIRTPSIRLVACGACVLWPKDLFG